MKRISLITLALCLSVFAQAQKFGLKAGLTLPNQKIGGVSQDMRVGYQAGAIVTLKLLGPVELEGNLLLTSKGSQHTVSNLGTDINLKTSLLYVDLPVKLNLTFDVAGTGIFIGAGPTFSYGLAGKIKSELTDNKGTWEETTNVKWGEENGCHYKTMDMSIGIQAGAKFLNKIRLAVGYDIGLQDIANDYEIMKFAIKAEETKNNVLTLSFAYMF